MREIVVVRKDNTHEVLEYSDSDVDLGLFNTSSQNHDKDAGHYSHDENALSNIIKNKSSSGKLGIINKYISTAFNNNKKRLELERKNKESEIRKLARLCLTLNRDRSIAKIARDNGFSFSRLDEPWRILWSDECHGLQSRVDQLGPYQRVNYFFSMQGLVKNYLYAYYWLALRNVCTEICDCFPLIWTLPREYLQLCKYMKEHPTKKYVQKPLGASCRVGLSVFDSKAALDRGTLGNCVVQSYYDKLFLIDGMKFKVTNFVLITAYGSNLRVFVHNEGTVQFYRDNNRPQFHNIDRKSQLLKWFRENGYDSDEIVRQFDETIVTAVIAINPHLTCEMEKRKISQKGKVCPCFQLIQINMLLDDHLNPIVLKMKDAPVVQDPNLKKRLFFDTITLCCVQNMRQFRAMVALGKYLKEKERKKNMEQRVREWIVESEEKEKLKRQMVEHTMKRPTEMGKCLMEQKNDKRIKLEARDGIGEKMTNVKIECVENVKKNDTKNKCENKKLTCEGKVRFKQTREIQKLPEQLTEVKLSKREDKVKRPIEMGQCLMEQKKDKRIKLEASDEIEEKMTKVKIECVKNVKTNETKNYCENKKLTCERKVRFKQTGKIQKLPEQLTEVKLSKKGDKLKRPIQLEKCLMEEKKDKRIKLEARDEIGEKMTNVKIECVKNVKTNETKNNCESKKLTCERKVISKQTGEIQKLSQQLTEEKLSQREDKVTKMENMNKNITPVKKRKVDPCFDNKGDKNKHETQLFVRRYQKPRSYVEILRNQRLMTLMSKNKKAKKYKRKEPEKNEIDKPALENTSAEGRHVSFDLRDSVEDLGQCNFIKKKQTKQCRHVALAKFHKLKEEQFRRRPKDSSVQREHSPLRAQFEWEKMNIGNFRLIYPTLDGDEFEDVLRGAAKISHFIQKHKGRNLFNVQYMRV